ncbi:hypothetical protein A2290_01845 [candidate division WOR-1 bacterium RIFOXYB2_FULL_36_35]|uniref:Uncharacterized protein n=1 Tax=candidate division WOR-1 bacterium RIFOXYB2_FULL_36_35 TaxID=1802578 RepID=A0A1F4S4B6_UNCSA|nr:MAG: hypothetical protein A2290_01845 [candidate division WOR-1 bacterium RIFOXYB2_FULL_36_35]OGC16245.1 MAG: hypothetical protein A2282_01400 [candidate division WOR-1 bacterium RIFOXYA12_FULL_36_13]
MADDRLIEAIESIRRDRKDPLRYIFFTFLNGIAYGFGIGIGMTVILGFILFVLTHVISGMVDIPLIGHYFNELGKIIESYSVQNAIIRR